MTVGIVVGTIANGGAQRVAITLTKWLNDNKNKAILIVLCNTTDNTYSVDGIPTAFLEDIYPGKGIKQRMQEFGTENNIDVYLVMDVPMCVYVIPALKNSKAKVVVSERSDPRHAKIKLPVKILSRILMKRADGFVFQTEDARSFYRQLKSKSVVIPNPVMNVPVITERIPNCERKKEIVTAGRLIEAKNHKMLLSSFKEITTLFPEYRLVIYGEGLLDSELKTFTKNLEIEEKVEFPGSVNDLHARIMNSELFVLTSDFEGMPNALMEAMAMGLTCISTDCPCGGPKELIRNGENGYLIPVGDSHTCAKRIENVLLNKDEADRVGKNALNVKIKYGKDSICQRWFDYIHYVTAGNKQK